MEQLDFLLVFTAHVTRKSQIKSQSAQPIYDTNTTGISSTNLSMSKEEMT